jgi:SNF2 family DNA or RNA helicase
VTDAWVVNADELLRLGDEGGKRAVSAREVYSAVQGEDPALPAMVFSRFPAKLVARFLPGKTSAGPRLEFAAVLHGDELPVKNVATRRSDHVTDGNRWFPLEDGALDAVRAALSDARIATDGELTLGQYLGFVQHARTHGIDIDDRWQGTAHSVACAESVSPDGLPPVNARLYSYQIQGFRWLSAVANEGLGCILGDEMGLGKTLQVITLFAAEKLSGQLPNLVVCPATLLENWRRELARFGPQLNVLVHQGAGRTGSTTLFSAADVVVTSYDTVIRDQILLSAVRWNCVVLDEAQAIKNPDAQRTAAVKSLPRRVSLAVTGTPVENRLEDLWSITDFVLPGMLGTRREFLAHFEDTATDAQRLGPLVSPILLRRLVSEVADDLPPRIDIPQPLRLDLAAAETYEQIRLDAEAAYGSAGGLVALGRLRMFCAHPCLVGKGTDEPAENWPKYQRLIEILEEIFSAGEKALIFSSYTEMADVIISDIPRRFVGVHVDWIDGRVAISERQTKVDRFTQSPGPGVLVLNPRAAGTGLNITAANHVIHYNPEWNPAVEDQASARAHRRGQTRPVTVHQLFYMGTVEEVIVDRLEAKRELAEGAARATNAEPDANEILGALRRSPLSTLTK